jgi:hypothetical protein
MPSNFYFTVAAKVAVMRSNLVEGEILPICSYHEHDRDDETIQACVANLRNAARGLPDWDKLEHNRWGRA